MASRHKQGTPVRIVPVPPAPSTPPLVMDDVAKLLVEIMTKYGRKAGT